MKIKVPLGCCYLVGERVELYSANVDGFGDIVGASAKRAIVFIYFISSLRSFLMKQSWLRKALQDWQR